MRFFHFDGRAAGEVRRTEAFSGRIGVGMTGLIVIKVVSQVNDFLVPGRFDGWRRVGRWFFLNHWLEFRHARYGC